MKRVISTGEHGETYVAHSLSTEYEATVFATPILELINAAWHNRFENLSALIPPAVIDEVTSPESGQNVEKMQARIAGVAALPTTVTVVYAEPQPDLSGQPGYDLVSVSVIETYIPRNPFKKSYPNVRDVEVAPRIGSQQSLAGAVALCYGLLFHDCNDEQRLSLYSEKYNQAGHDWLYSLGMTRTGREVSQDTKAGSMPYVQFGADKTETVKNALCAQFPQLTL